MLCAGAGSGTCCPLGARSGAGGPGVCVFPARGRAVRVWLGARRSLGSSQGRGPRGGQWGRRAGQGQAVVGRGGAGAVARLRGAWLASREAAIGAVLGRLPLGRGVIGLT